MAWGGHSQQGSIAVRLGKVPQRIFLKYKETGTSAGIPVALTGWPVPIHLGKQEGPRYPGLVHGRRERPREQTGNKIGRVLEAYSVHGGFAEENSDVFCCAVNCGERMSISIRCVEYAVQYMQPYTAGDTAKGWDHPPEKHLRTGESRAVIMMLCMSLWPGFCAAVKPRAHLLTAARKHGDAHN